MDEDIYYLICLFIIGLFLLGGAYIIGKIDCNAKAKALNYKCKYEFIAGCILEKPDGKKVLLQQLRDFSN